MKKASVAAEVGVATCPPNIGLNVYDRYLEKRAQWTLTDVENFLMCNIVIGLFLKGDHLYSPSQWEAVLSPRDPRR